MQLTPRPSSECFQRYNEIVKQSKWRAVIFKLNGDESEIVVEKCISVDEDYSDFINSFPSNDIRWCLIDFPFVRWCPDTLTRESFKESARVKTSAVTFANIIRKQFTQVAFNYQANDHNDLTREALLSKLSKYERDTVDEGCINDLLPLDSSRLIFVQ